MQSNPLTLIIPDSVRKALKEESKKTKFKGKVSPYVNSLIISGLISSGKIKDTKALRDLI